MYTIVDIKDVIYLNGCLCKKRCRKEWFIKNKKDDIYNFILDKTNFLPNTVRFTERLYCIEHNITNNVLCCQCNIKPVNFGYNSEIKQNEYNKFCSYKCANISIETKNKIEATNFERYGYIRPLNYNYELLQKSKQTILEKYGVDNVSKSEIIKNKKKETCLFNHGVLYPMQDQNILNKSSITNIQKYGTKNVLNSGSKIRININKQNKKNTYKNLVKKFEEYVEIITTLNEYIIDNVLEFKCKKCEDIFQSKYISINRIPRCYNCYPIFSGISNIEKEVVEFIRSIGINNIIENSKKIISPLELDIYLPDYNLAIEFNGLYWHSEISGNTDKFYHIIKTKECNQKNIKLIHIFEDEWINKKEIVKSILKENCKNGLYTINSRKCNIKEVNKEDSEKFLENNHIQGYIKSDINIGLYYNSELVSLMTFLNKADKYELIRFCNKINTNIPGAASKLFKNFIKEYNPKDIITFSDISKFGININNSIYKKLGFNFVTTTSPNYWYIGKNGIREYRYKYRKDIIKNKLLIFDENLTEWENMQINNYDRIWDCGSLKFQWNKEN